MQNKSEPNNKIVLSPKQELAIIQPKLDAIDQFINLTRSNQIELRDKQFGVFTLERIVKNLDKSLPLSGINKLAPKKCTYFIKEIFFQFCEQLNFERTLTPNNIDELVSYIKLHHWFYTVADIHLMLSMLKAGKLYEYDQNGNSKGVIKLYGSVNITIMYDVIRSYEKQRHETIMNTNEGGYVREVGETSNGLMKSDYFKKAKNELSKAELKPIVDAAVAKANKKSKKKP
jgi:hypothetical protein